MVHEFFGAGAVMATADRTIGECVSMLKDSNVGSVLILHENGSEVIGIFTERDVIRQIDLIRQHDYWSKPVRLVMTKKLITLPHNRVAEAPRFLLDNKIRHLPITDPVTGGVVGMVSIRDAVRHLLTITEAINSPGSKGVPMGYLGSQGPIRELVTALVDSMGGEVVNFSLANSSKPSVRGSEGLWKGLFVHVNDSILAGFPEFLKRRAREGYEEFIVLLLDVAGVDSRKIQALQQLDRKQLMGKQIYVFEMPIQIYPLMTLLHGFKITP